MRTNLRILAAGAVCVGATVGLMNGAESPTPERESRIDSAVREAAAPAPVAVAPAPASVAEVRLESDAPQARVEQALRVLGPSVPKQSDPGALRAAVKAYYSYQAANPEKVRKPYLYYVDYGLDAATPRGYVFDMKKLEVVDGPFTVAHGRGSKPTAKGVPTRFSNRQGSNSTSLGLYLAQETYGFSGKSGGKAYRSVGLRLAGLSGEFNSAARARGVVAHGAPYVTATKAGRSEGCPAMESKRADKLLPRIANGGLVFHFSPLDRKWLQEDPWINRG